MLSDIAGRDTRTMKHRHAREDRTAVRAGWTWDES
jgi:hypothetical protein